MDWQSIHGESEVTTYTIVNTCLFNKKKIKKQKHESSGVRVSTKLLSNYHEQVHYETDKNRQQEND